MSAPAYMPVIERAFEETLGLLTEARDIIVERMAADDADLEPRLRLEVMAEQFRLTSRLSSVLAWLFFRKAVAAGEAKETDLIASVTRLDGDAYWRTERHQPKGPLPADLVDLLERSRLLYDRAARLDGMIHTQAGQAIVRQAAEDPRTDADRRQTDQTDMGTTLGRLIRRGGVPNVPLSQPERRAATDRRHRDA